MTLTEQLILKTFKELVEKEKDKTNAEPLNEQGAAEQYLNKLGYLRGLNKSIDILEMALLSQPNM